MPLSGARNGTKQYRFTRRYKVNDDYFEKIDSPSKAYWLGFLMADGYVQEGDKNHRGRISIHLQRKDIEVLENFKKDLCADYPIKIRSNGYRVDGRKKMSCVLEFRLEKIVNDLIGWGCVNKKSLKLNFPTRLNKDLFSHFIRGYFDGDGSICGNGTTSNVFKIVGTLSFVGRLQEILMKNCRLGKTKIDPHPNGKSGTVRYVGNKQLKRIYNYLYNNASQFLGRKQSFFQEIVGVS